MRVSSVNRIPGPLRSPAIVAAEPVAPLAPGIIGQRIRYLSDDLTVAGWLAIREDLLQRPLGSVPGLLYCRGGIRRVGAVKKEWLIRFARHGAVVFAPCYRGNEGGQGKEDFGLKDREDARAALELLRRVALVHADKLAVYGFSRGGPLAFFCAARSDVGVRNDAGSSTLRSSPVPVVLHGGVSDLALTYAQRPDLRRMLNALVGGTPTQTPDAYRARSPLSQCDDPELRVLLIHGLDDVQVSPEHSRRLHERLREVGARSAMWNLVGVGHHPHPLAFDELTRRMYMWAGLTQ
ncbi:MAG: prolyl oligopeptidase family serine peptidase [Firmicutes bacterium]|nr:prolyl oligopeptidase family serine peptidase [Bacillota bacterium]